MTLVFALSNTASVMQQTNTQYLSREFAITSDAAQKAPLEDLVADLQNIYHRCKKEAGRLDTAKEILSALSVIASKQGTPQEQAHFAKIKEIAVSALAPEGQTDDKDSRAKYFQDKLILLLYAKKLMTAVGIEAYTASAYTDSLTKCLEVFEQRRCPPRNNAHCEETYTYRTPNEDLSSFALSALFRISHLCEIEGQQGNRPLTREELLELESYCKHEDAQVKKFAEDYTLLRKRFAALIPSNKSIEFLKNFTVMGFKCGNKFMIYEKEGIVAPKPLSPFYPAFDNYVNFLNTQENNTYSVPKLTERNQQLQSLYEEHLTQLPVVHFAYRFFYDELTQVCSLFPSRIAAAKYKKAYPDYEGNVLPVPDEFRSIEAVFPEPVFLPQPPVEEEKIEVSSKKPQQSSKKSKSAKPKKQVPAKPASRPLQIKLENAQTKTTSSTSSSTTNNAKENAAGYLKVDSLPFNEITYDSRVSLWFTNPEDCLALPSYADLNEKVKEIVVQKHTFPNALDQLVGTAYSVQETYQNSKKNLVDILFSIPGEIESVNGKKMRGLFQYCFGGKDKVCYHRCFKEMSTRDLLNHDQYGQAFEEAEFPPLSLQAVSVTPTKKNADQELFYEPNLNTYAVKDKSKGLTFRAFKIRDLT